MSRDSRKPTRSNPLKGPIRLQKVLSVAGLASRREAERLIAAGRVTVNGKAVAVGTKVLQGDTVRLDGMVVPVQTALHYLLIHKPQGMLCTLSDPLGRPKVVDMIPERYGRLFPVGRLDWNSEGVVLLTNDGELAQQLMHPKYQVPKVYSVKVKGQVEPNDPRLDTIRAGIRLDDGTSVHVEDLRWGKFTKKNTWIEMILTEGKKREVRRICKAAGLTVVRLIRVAFGPLTLEGLKQGEWRELSPMEVQRLKALHA